MKRRDFLRRTGWFAASAALVGLPGAGCGDNASPDPIPEPEAEGTYKFPQGVASGDPRSTSVVLWTRCVIAAAGEASTGAINLRVQVATSTAFHKLVVDQEVIAARPADHTVRVLVTGLAANTTYFYRFIAGSDYIYGRTRTAPDPTADVQVNLAWVSCQDYSAGSFGAYRQMIVDDAARPPADQIFAVVHLGDMIYETRADAFQTAIDESFQPIALKNRDGSDRIVPPFPSDPAATFARTVDDYRHLYKTFFSDPDIQAARALWPFIAIWDDHEFTDDCWQSQANYTSASSLDEPSQTRKIAASQAWFEYVPAELSGALGASGVESEAHDFFGAEVEDKPFTAPNDDNFVDEPNNAAAVGALSIYRSLRFGKHVELVMTDERSYRSDHAIPEDITRLPQFLAPRNALPLQLVSIMDQGKTFAGGHPPAVIPFGGANIPNVRALSPAGTMLGAQQKAWFKATMKASDATWKLWGNEVTVMRLRIPALGADQPDLVLSADAWDGYPTERNELVAFLKDEGIKNVVILSGDIHASFAGVVMDNPDLPVAMQTPVATELVASGIASNSLFSFFEFATRAQPAALRGLITVDGTAAGLPKFTENFNLLLSGGVNAAGTFAASKNLAAALQAANPDTNKHLKYVDTNAQGYGYVKINGTQVAAKIVTINRPIGAPTDAAPGIKRTASFTIPKDNPGGMSAATFTGAKPFPLG
jgi:alkaline phosphatase D